MKHIKPYQLILGAVLLLTIPIGLYIRQFYTPNFSDNKEDWQVFATYFGGIVGTVGSLIVGYFVYDTL